MLNQQTMSILHSLKLFGLARSFEERLADPKQANSPMPNLWGCWCRMRKPTGII